MLHRTALRIAAGIFCVFGCTAAMAQQAYPSKPIMVISSAAPGTEDGAIFMTKLSEYLNQPVVLVYKTGASSLISMDYVAKAAPDGYTFLLVSATFSLVPLMDDKPPFDGHNAFTPVSLLTKGWAVLAAHPSLPANNLKELVAYAKANPSVINFGTAGVGTRQHLTGAWLQGLTGTNWTYIHYKSGGLAQADLFGGHVHVAFMDMNAAAPHVKAGKLKMLGLTNPTRNPAYPDIPTLTEQGGWKDFGYTAWKGLSAPAKTPAAIVNRISSALARVVNSPDIVKARAAEVQLVGSTPEEFGRTINAETETWRKVLKENNIKLDKL